MFIVSNKSRDFRWEALHESLRPKFSYYDRKSKNDDVATLA